MISPGIECRSILKYKAFWAESDVFGVERGRFGLQIKALAPNISFDFFFFPPFGQGHNERIAMAFLGVWRDWPSHFFFSWPRPLLSAHQMNALSCDVVTENIQRARTRVLGALQRSSVVPACLFSACHFHADNFFALLVKPLIHLKATGGQRATCAPPSSSSSVLADASP